MSLEYRFPVIATWAVIVLIAVQDVVVEVVQSNHPMLLWAVALCGAVTCTLFLRWQWLTLKRAPARDRAGYVAALAVSVAIGLRVDMQWGAIALPPAAAMLTFSWQRAWVLASTYFLGACVYVGLVWAWQPALMVLPLEVLLATVLYGFTRLSLVIQDLQVAREELARTRVDEERLRIQRDLHDMLGRTLVTASMRNQVAIRTIPKGEDAVRSQLEQLHQVISDGQARLRALTSGPVIASLADEIESARTLCERIGIQFIVDVVPVEPSAVEQYAGSLVRECVTNVLKHSQGRHCWVAVTRADEPGPPRLRVSVENDGYIPGGRDPSQGTGLAHLRSGAERLGGTFAAGATGGGRFRVAVELPDPAAAAGDSPAGQSVVSPGGLDREETP